MVPMTGHDIRNLRRSSDDRVIAGVCGGLGSYTGVDPVIFRIALGVLAVFGGAGLLLYALAWLVVPEDTATQSEAQRLLHGRGTPLTVFAVGVGVLGILTLADLVRRGWPGPFPAVVIVIALGALVFYRRGWAWADPRPPAGTTRTGGGFFGSETPASTPPPASAPPPTFAFTPQPAAPPASAPLGPPAGFAPSRPAWEPPQGPMYAAYDRTPEKPVVARPPRQPSLLVPIALCTGLVAAGVLLALGASHALDVTAQAVFAVALLTIGLALVAGTWIGRGRSLVAVGALLTVGLVVVATVDVPLRGGIGYRADAPASLTDLHSEYHLAIGQENLDLSAVLLDGSTKHVDVTVGVGELRVTVPPTAALVVHASTGTGRISLLGADVRGTHLDRDLTYAATDGAAAGQINLDLHVGVGSLVVDRIPAGVQQ